MMVLLDADVQLDRKLLETEVESLPCHLSIGLQDLVYFGTWNVSKTSMPIL